jgi:hypothetical protein
MDRTVPHCAQCPLFICSCACFMLETPLHREVPTLHHMMMFSKMVRVRIRSDDTHPERFEQLEVCLA